MDDRVIAEIFQIPLFGRERAISLPGNTGVLVAVGVALGSVAVCALSPIATKTMTAPSLMRRMTEPCPGNATDALAVVVTDMGSVLTAHVNGCTFIRSSRVGCY